MARPLRIEFPNALYHVTSRGNERKPIYKRDNDRLHFLDILSDTRDRFNWIVHAYCLMDNHYHLLIETPDSNLSGGMRQLNGVYTQSFNRAHRRVGHVLQGRFKAILVQKEGHLLEVARYIVLNPVRAGAVEKPEKWRWSSHHGTAGLRKAHPCLSVDWMLSQFGKQKRHAQKRYRAFVREGVGAESIWEETRGLIALGDDGFIKLISTHLQGAEELKEFSRAQRFVARPELEAMFGGVSNKVDRNLIMVKAVRNHGYSQKEVALYLGLHYSTVSRLIKQEMSKYKT